MDGALLRGYRGLFATASLVAMTSSLVLQIGDAGFTVGNFFSYFTYESNIAAMVVLFVGALAPEPPDAPARHRRDLVRGAVTLYMVITGLVYNVLLAGDDVDVALAWIDTMVHRIMPIVVLIDWVVDPPAERVRVRQALVWLVFPLAYLPYSLVRGEITGWYPYYFLDPGENGYAQVAVYAVVLAALMALLALAVATLGNVAHRLAPRGRGVTLRRHAVGGRAEG